MGQTRKKIFEVCGIWVESDCLIHAPWRSVVGYRCSMMAPLTARRTVNHRTCDRKGLPLPAEVATIIWWTLVTGRPWNRGKRARVKPGICLWFTSPAFESCVPERARTSVGGCKTLPLHWGFAWIEHLKLSCDVCELLIGSRCKF